jgi:CheY-like chemotaxis protein
MKTKKTILIVEDEKILRAAVVDILRIKNFLPLEARNGNEGVEVALKKHPDLILLDLIMPAMDGMAAFKKIRQDPWGKKIPIIILTNLSVASEQLADTLAMDRSTHYLIKSDWKIHDIVRKIEGILEGKDIL